MKTCITIAIIGLCSALTLHHHSARPSQIGGSESGFCYYIRGVGGYVPVEVIADVLGSPAVTDPVTQEVTLTAGAKQITMIPYVPYVRGYPSECMLRLTPFLWQGKVMTPLDVIADAFELKENVNDDETQCTLTNPATMRSRSIPVVAYDLVNPPYTPVNEGALNKAIRSGNLDEVRSLLERFPSCLTSGDALAGEPLAVAAGTGNNAIVQYLLDHGTDSATPATWPSQQLWDPPAFAMFSAWEHKRVSTVDLLAQRTYSARPWMIAIFSSWSEYPRARRCMINQQKIVKAMCDDAVNHNGQFPDARTWTQPFKSAALPALPVHTAPLTSFLLHTMYEIGPVEETVFDFYDVTDTRATDVNIPVGATPASPAPDPLPWDCIPVNEIEPGLAHSVLQCPDRPDLAVGYGYNAHLSGQKWSSLADPAHTVVLADCSNSNHLLLSEDDIDWDRHGYATVCFADCHTEQVKLDPRHPLRFANSRLDPVPADLTPGPVIPAPPQPQANVAPAVAIKAGKVEDVRALLTATPALMTTSLGGDTNLPPLTYACALGQRDIVKLLLQMGAVPSDDDVSAAILIAGAPDIVQMFMKPQAVNP